MVLVLLLDAEPTGDLVAGHPPHGAGITDHLELVRGPRHPDVQPLPCAVACAVLVEAQHDGPSLEALAAEDVPVEDVVIPVRAPVALLVVEGRALHLDRVAVASGEEGDVAWLPALVQQPVHLVVGCADRVVQGGLHEADGRSVATT